MFFIFLQFTLIAGADLYDGNDLIVLGNLKKREQIPLSEINRRVIINNNLNYRRTKDIRHPVYFRRNGNEVTVDKQRDEAIDRKVDENMIRRNRNEILERRKIELFDRNNEIEKRNNEEIWDLTQDTFNKHRDELDQQSKIDRQNYAIDKTRDIKLDRRFEQSERELSRMDDAQDRLDKLHQELQWLSINTNR